MSAAAVAPARIGPNAIIQVAAALVQAHGAAVAGRVFAAAGLAPYLAAPPAGMVEEREVIALHRELRRVLDPAAAGAVARVAGGATGDYLLRHRIPLPVQRLLGWLPRRLAARLLVAAIARHAWTFVGSGRLTTAVGRGVVLTIEDCPICRGTHAPAAVCEYYRATFERLFRALVDARTTVRETLCAAVGDGRCRFELEWP
ncbi:MAG: bacteriochlorophyll 4-vinyl reductase [Proteobacteria bacterium]|nr:bacteriochlorophyll 4-vinyl reductase [Pseudomonadota bacterium]